MSGSRSSMAIFHRYTPTEQQKAAALTFTPARGGVLQRACACGQHTIAGADCDKCRKKRVEGSLKGARGLQRSPNHQAGETAVTPIVYDVLRSPRHPLDATTRAFFPPRL